MRVNNNVAVHSYYFLTKQMPRHSNCFLDISARPYNTAVHLRQNSKGSIVAAIIAFLVFAVVIGSFAYVIKNRVSEKLAADTAPTTAVALPDQLKGLSFSPKSTSGSDITDFFDKAATLKGAVTWAGDWQELSKSSGGPQVVISQSQKRSLTPIAIATTHRDAGQSKLSAIRPLTSSQLDQYVQSAKDFASKNKPAYLGLGIEVNRIYESNHTEYQQFVDLFSRSADAVHAASPNTKVFTTFQLERLRGLKGGLFGGSNNEADNQWQLINDFPKADVVGFTSYPSLIYHSAADMPSDYYSAITKHTDKPVLFSELGWSAGTVAKGWDGTPELQLQFVQRFFELTIALKPKVTIWSFLYDPSTIVPFNTMGLFSADGTQRPGWQALVDAQP